ncbi:MAG: hypothetical protein KDJ35_03410 [Alphaproteobacteria bacterium]|nr:hypothetical protein [Alphaproteobacteria bacterium]
MSIHGHLRGLALSFLLISLTCLGARIAPAQDAGELLLDAPVSQQSTAENEEEDIPDEYFDEAIGFLEQCQAKPQLQSHYDCECLSSSLLDLRIKTGPDVNTSSLLLQLDGKCKSAVNLAGAEYEQCMTSYYAQPKGVPAEKYCSCFANTYAKMFERSPAKPSAKLSVALHQRASLACRDPELARKLYPEISSMISN